jgi:signal transduction histidine kinase
VRITYEPTAIALEITDDGSANGASRGGGRGLLGMRERAAFFGGDFDAGPRRDGGFRVFARLPVESQP